MKLIEFLKTFTKINNNFIDDFFSLGVFNFSSYNFILYFFNEQTIIFKII